MKMHTAKLTRERGQSVVQLALMLTGIVSMVTVALVSGRGLTSLLRWQMQNAADAAALAAADELAEGQATLVYYRIQQYAVGDTTIGNEATTFSAQYLPSQVAATPDMPPPPGTNCVRVTAHKSFEFAFVSLPNLTLASATATGCFGQVMHPDTALWPLAVNAQSFQKNAIYSLKGGNSGDQAQFAWLSYDGSNSASARWASFPSGVSGSFQAYAASPCDGSAQSAVASFSLPACIKGTFGMDAADQGSAAARLGQVVIVPLYDRVSGQGSDSYYHIVALAAFKISGVCLQGAGVGDCVGTSAQEISGRFVDYVVSGQFCNSNCGPDYGLKTIVLKE